VTWTKIGDEIWSDPDLTGLSDRAFRLQVNCYAYSSDKLTDGRLDARQVEQVAFMFGLTGDDLKTAISELVHNGQWTEDLHGYVLVRYLEQNPTREKVIDDRRKNREKQAAWLKKHRRRLG
jgi:hypothetical protein